ncbi:MAG: hypothetical protein MUF31_19120 [Akkermansiaceae bacterium]|nr:hypothetical protein [Akkermansiaceae bacterium]
MSALFDLRGKVVVITGATGTLTGSAADYLAGEGARVVYLGRSREKLDAALISPLSSRSWTSTSTAPCFPPSPSFRLC